MNWIKDSNRPYHFWIGFWSALFGTLIGAIEVGIAMEGKDCQGDPLNQGQSIRNWTWRNWDWKDFWATVLGGLGGQVAQLLIVWVIVMTT